jgi:hypothetical protein
VNLGEAGMWTEIIHGPVLPDEGMMDRKIERIKDRQVIPYASPYVSREGTCAVIKYSIFNIYRIRNRFGSIIS